MLRTRRLAVLAFVTTVSLLVVARSGPRPALPTHRDAPAARWATGLFFEQNVGQHDPWAGFVARSGGATVFLGSDGAVLSFPPDPGRALQAAALRLRVAGASGGALVGYEPLATRVNVLQGRDRSRWRVGVPTFGRVEVQGVLPGTDLAFYGAAGGLEYDVTVAPGVDPSSVRLVFEGAEEVALDAEGDLRVRLGGRELLQRRPRVYQEVDGHRRDVGAAYVVTGGGEVAVRVERHDPGRAVVIDPVVIWSTFLSGGVADEVWAVASDSAALLAVGRATSTDFPTTTGVLAVAPRGGAADCFVSRLTGDGASLLVSTFLGGDGDDECRGVASLGAGGVAVAGHTTSADFPTKGGGFQRELAGGRDGFLGVLTADLTDFHWLTYLGGAGDEQVRGLRLSNGGDLVAFGSTASSAFPVTSGAAQTALAGGGDGFLAAFATASGTRTWVTLLGGGGTESVAAVAQNSAGVLFAVGASSSTSTTWSADFDGSGHADGDAFVARLASDGSSVFSFDFLGGGGGDEALAVGLDGNNNTCVAGTTRSGDFPATTGAAQRTFGGGTTDGFVGLLSGSSLLQAATYLGGSGDEEVLACGFDVSGDVWAAGSTLSANLPGAGGASGRLFHARTDAALGRAFSSALAGGTGSLALRAVRDHGDLIFAGGAFGGAQAFPTSAGAYQANSAAAPGGFLLALRTFPFASSISPGVVTTAGGVALTFTGGNWTAAPTVHFCGGPAVGCTVQDATHLLCTAPAGVAGTCQVALEYPGTASGYQLGNVTYSAPPTVSGVTPGHGLGGDLVLVTGSGFAGTPTVRFGDVEATGVILHSATELECHVPSHAAGLVAVEVTNPDGLSVLLADAFTFDASGGGGGGADGAHGDPYACGHAGGGLALLGTLLLLWRTARRRRTGPAILLLLLLPSLAAAQASPARQARAQVAVLPVKVAVGLEPRLGDVVTDALVAAVQGRGVSVISTKEIEGMLGFERQKQMLGCAEDASCLAEIGGALGVDGVVMSQVARVGDTLVFSAQRLDAKKGVTVGRSLQRLKGGRDEALLEAADVAAAELFPGRTAVAPPRPVAATPAADRGAFLIGLHAAAEVGTRGGALGLDAGWRFSPRLSLVGSAVVTGGRRPAVEVRVPWTLLGTGRRWQGLLVPQATVILGGDGAQAGGGLGVAAAWAFSGSGALRFELPVTKVSGVSGVTVLPTLALAFAL